MLAASVAPALADTTAPALLAVDVPDGRTMVLTFDEDVVTGNLSDLRYAFSVSGLYDVGTGNRRTSLVPSGVMVVGTKVTLTWNPGGVEALPGREISVTYNTTVAEEANAGLQDANGNKVAGFEGRTATLQATGPIPPVLTAVQVAGKTLTLTFDRTLDENSRPAGRRFRAMHIAADWSGDATFLSGTGTAVVSGTRVTVTLAEAVPPDRFAQVDYRRGDDTNPLRGASSGPEVANFGWLIATVLAPPPSGRGAPEGSGAPSDTAPDFGEALVAALLLSRGEAMDPVVLPAAAGGDGALSYTLTSDPAGLAGLDFSPASRRLSGTPGAAGDWTFTYRADDADDNRTVSDAAVLTFQVTVEDPRLAQVKRSVRRTLAAVARRALTSALDNIGARFAASVAGSSLMVAGETVPLGAGLAGGLAEAARPCGPERPGDAWRTGFTAHDDGCAAAWSRGVEMAELRHASAFSLTLGAVEDSAAPLWSVWGRGDLGSFAGEPGPGMRYEGTLRTGWLGVDARSGPWVAGLAVSHGTGEADYSFQDRSGSGAGRLETTLTALYPYGRWTLPGGLELRGVLGAGRGDAVHRLDGCESETSDLAMWMGSLGLRHELSRLAGIDLAARGDASLARLETDEGPQSVDGLTASSWRARLGLEASRRFTLDDAALVPFVEAAGRRDGGDGLTGTGVEVAGGVRWEAPGVHVEARGRWLAAHTQGGTEERGLSLTARLGPGAHGRGLQLALSPRWGADTGSAQALWRDELPQAAGGAAAAVDARIGYGLGVAPYGLLTPFAETGLADGESRRLRLGTRFEGWRADLGVELAGERSESGAGPEHVLRLDVRLRF